MASKFKRAYLREIEKRITRDSLFTRGSYTGSLDSAITKQLQTKKGEKGSPLFSASLDRYLYTASIPCEALADSLVAQGTEIHLVPLQQDSPVQLDADRKRTRSAKYDFRATTIASNPLHLSPNPLVRLCIVRRLCIGIGL